MTAPLSIGQAALAYRVHRATLARRLLACRPAARTVVRRLPTPLYAVADVEAAVAAIHAARERCRAGRNPGGGGKPKARPRPEPAAPAPVSDPIEDVARAAWLTAADLAEIERRRLLFAARRAG